MNTNTAAAYIYIYINNDDYDDICCVDAQKEYQEG